MQGLSITKWTCTCKLDDFDSRFTSLLFTYIQRKTAFILEASRPCGICHPTTLFQTSLSQNLACFQVRNGTYNPKNILVIRYPKIFNRYLTEFSDKFKDLHTGSHERKLYFSICLGHYLKLLLWKVSAGIWRLCCQVLSGIPPQGWLPNFRPKMNLFLPRVLHPHDWHECLAKTWLKLLLSFGIDIQGIHTYCKLPHRLRPHLQDWMASR